MSEGDAKFDPILGKIREEDSSVSGDFVLKAGDTMSGPLDMSLNQILNFRIENTALLPSAGNKGRLVYLTTDDSLYLDRG